MGDIVVKTSSAPEEIEENFKEFDLTAALKESLKAAIAYENGEPLPGTVVREYTLSGVDGSIVDVRKTVY